MKHSIIALVLATLILTGCGGSSKDDVDTQYLDSHTNLEENNGTNIINKNKKDTVENNNINDNRDPLTVIQDMIKDAKSGKLQDVRYLSIGDSTRAYTRYMGEENHSEKIFELVKEGLKPYNVDARLVSQGGLTFKAFLGEHYENDTRDDWINIQEAIDQIEGDGEHTIVNISMISNDFTALNNKYSKQFKLEQYQGDHGKYYDEKIAPIIKKELKQVMLRVIDRLKSAKPKIHLILTSPNPERDWKRGSNVYLSVYKDVAKELNIPYLDIVGEVMPPRSDKEAFKSWYNDAIHFSKDVGIPKTAEFILSKILP